MVKKRLDVVMFEKGFTKSRAHAQRIIMAGNVSVNGVKVTKAGHQICDNDVIDLALEQNKFVSRGGNKLYGALKNFNIDVKNEICLDIGASTGGFTDCLLKQGAKKVYAVDVGYGQLDF
ncbi:SAM-dependent methyltransferase, partial [bacterium]